MNDTSTTVRLREDVFPREFREREEHLINERRNLAGVPQEDERVGIALSGGGIRSATFCLGLFQGLARRGLVRRMDYLSTVSGGGYFGSFLGRLFTRPWINGVQPVQFAPQAPPPAGASAPTGNAPPTGWSTPASPPAEAPVWDTSHMFRFLGLITGKGGTEVARCYNKDATPAHAEGLGGQPPGVARVEFILNCPASRPMSWLRDNGRYLSPNGTSDMLTDGALAVRNWVALTAVMGLFLLLCFLGFNLLRGTLWHFYPEWWFTKIEWPLLLATDPAKGYLWWSPYVYLPLIVLVIFAIPLGWAYWLTQGGLAGGRFLLPPLTALLTGIAAVAVGFLESYRPDLARFWYALAGLIVLALACWWLVNRLCPLGKGTPGATRWIRSQLTLSLKTAMVVAAVLLALAVADSVGQSLYAVLSVSGWDIVFSWKSLATVSGITAVLAAARNLALLLEKFPKLGAWRMPLDALAIVLALVVLFALPVILAVVAHGFAWSWSVPQPQFTLTETVGANSMPATNLTINPGLNLLSSSVRRDRVFLSAEKYIVVGETSQPPEFSRPKARMSYRAQIWTALICLFLAITYGQTFTFLNLSSLQQVYGARLVRSYLGASNPNRWEGAGQRLSDVVHCDDVRFEEYRPHEHGGPLHLINVTLNETLSGKTNVEFRDRKGLSMAVGPCGLSVGLRDHAVWTGEKNSSGDSFIRPVGFQESKFHALATSAEPHTVESLSLGHWIAISGAAFTTGLGARTSLSKSLLLGLANVRLGYWWDSHIRPQKRGSARTPLKAGGRLAELMNQLFYVQTNLLNEFLGHFHGPARRLWYLSDGGHYENTAAYELLRRRVPFIIICDNGCDPTYDFADLANLVRKARVDFGAEIEFVRRKKSDDVNPPRSSEAAHPSTPAAAPLPFVEDLVHPEFCDLIGAPEDFKLPDDDKSEAGAEADPRPRRARHHALLARVRYPQEKPDGPPEVSWLLVLKPGLSGDEPLDLIQYQKTQPDFPQESTMDQYFDEAQWESYRKLGEHIAGLVFAIPKHPAGKWYPGQMRRPM